MSLRGNMPVTFLDEIRGKIAKKSALRDETWCTKTAKSVTNLLVGGSAENMFPTLHGDVCLNSQFFTKDEARYKFAFVQRLFEKPSTEQALAFHFVLPKNLHEFIIYKERTDGENSYVIFQSSLHKYSIGQWLGLVSEAMDEEDVGDRAEYGNCQRLSSAKIAEFIKTIFQRFEKSGCHSIEVKIYPVAAKLEQKDEKTATPLTDLFAHSDRTPEKTASESEVKKSRNEPY